MLSRTVNLVLIVFTINRLNTELNSICHLLALLGAHHILHVSRIRVNATEGLLGEEGVLKQVRDRLMRTLPPGKICLKVWCISKM
jgi:hypothetical protein